MSVSVTPTQAISTFLNLRETTWSQRKSILQGISNNPVKTLLKHIVMGIHYIPNGSPSLSLFKLTKKVDKEAVKQRFMTFISMLKKDYQFRVHKKGEVTDTLLHTVPIFASVPLHSKEANFYYRLLNGENFGIDYSLVVDIVGEDFIDKNLFPSFCEGIRSTRNKSSNFPLYVEPCIDGDKLKILADHGKVTVVSQNGNVFTGIFKQLEKKLSLLSASHKFEIDAMGYAKDYSLNSWRTLIYTRFTSISRLESKSEFDPSLLHISIYDMIIDDKYNEKLSIRKTYVNKLVEKCENSKILYVQRMLSRKAESLDDLQYLLKGRINKSFGKEINEQRKGYILKSCSSTYTYGRNDDWVKVRHESAPECVRVVDLNITFMPSVRVVSIVGITNNNKYLTVEVDNTSQASWLYVRKDNLYGATAEVVWRDERPVFFRIIPERGTFN